MEQDHTFIVPGCLVPGTAGNMQKRRIRRKPGREGLAPSCAMTVRERQRCCCNQQDPPPTVTGLGPQESLWMSARVPCAVGCAAEGAAVGFRNPAVRSWRLSQRPGSFWREREELEMLRVCWVWEGMFGERGALRGLGLASPL